MLLLPLLCTTDTEAEGSQESARGRISLDYREELVYPGSVTDRRGRSGSMRIEHWLYSLPLRLRSLFRRRRVEQELDDELQFHLERKVEEYMMQGMKSREARQAALRAMDGLAQRKEECRDMRRVNAIEDTVRDIRYGLRVLAKSPGFTAVAVLTLTLAIGANAVVFGVMNAAILRPLNVPQAESLYAIQRGRNNVAAQSYPDYLDLRDRNRSFDDLAAYSITMAGLDTGETPSRVWVYEVTGNYFEALGIKPYLGRFIRASDENGPNSAPYIVLSYSYWHTHFQDDRGVVGRSVQINKYPFTIVGVAPPDFHGTVLFLSPDVFVPIVNREQLEGPSTRGANVLTVRGTRALFMVIGHLKAGITQAQAIADLNSIGVDLEKTYPNVDSDMKFSLARPGLVGDLLGRPVRSFVAGLMLLAALILLAACANLGSLFGGRAADRAREVALRLALGASRNRILRQLLTEAVLISLMGGAIGLWGSVMLLRALSVWHPVPRYPVYLPVEPDPKVYAIALILAVVSGILFGLVPARQVHRTDPYQVIKAGATGTAGRRIAMRDLLLAVQIAICAVLVTSSLVAVRGLERSLHSNFGFEPRNAMVMNTNLDMGGYRGEAVSVMQRRMVDGMQTFPGVTSAALIDRLPLSGNWIQTDVFTDGTTDTRPANAAAVPVMFSISPEYFQTAGTALLAGRAFTRHDDKSVARVAVVNRVFATRVFGSVATALGGTFRRRDGTRIQVVGVVGDGKLKSLTEDPQPAMFFPILQVPATDTWLVVRSSADPQQLAGAMRNTLKRLDAGLPYYMEVWNNELDLALFPSRVATVALGVLGLMGAMLSITGIFGMAAYSVSKRLKELGIRIALGAQRKEVLRVALGRALKLLVFGSVAGVLLGILASQVLALIVYQANPRDPVVLAGVALAMLLLGLLATWIPAQRALSLDPVKLLREE
jgi:predicted permease